MSRRKPEQQSEQSEQTPQKLPDQQRTQPGVTYDNPNEDQHYVPPEQSEPAEQDRDRD